MINICNKTLSHFSKILKQTNHTYILIGVKGGGCNGIKYFIEPTSEKPDKLDEIVKKGDVNIIVCGKSLLHLIGSEIKWNEDFMGSGIEFTNPNAKGSCGCGESWSF